MTYQIQINAGQHNVSLPDGHLYNEGDIVNLTDEQYNETTASARNTAFAVLTYTPDGGGGGGTGGPEVDPIASAALTTHKTSTDHDTHNDGRYDSKNAASGAVTTHNAATDPHGDRGHSDAADATHVGAADPHGDRAHSDGALATHKTSADHDGHNDARYDVVGAANTAVATHSGAPDAHGDRAYTDSRLSALTGGTLETALDTLAEIDAQIRSDESGTAAILATQNSHTTSIASNATAITAEQTRATAAEGTNATNLTNHVNNTTGAHAASAVSVSTSGLVVVTHTNVQAALADLDAATNARVLGDFSGATDGQLAKWSTAQGKLVPQNPIGAEELSYAANVTGTVTTTAVGGENDIPGCTVSVAANTRPVWLLAEVVLKQSVAGKGLITVALYETTGAATFLANIGMAGAPNSIDNDGFLQVRGFYRLGSVASTRTFKIRLGLIALGTPVGTPSVQAQNSAANPSYLTAVAR